MKLLFIVKNREWPYTQESTNPYSKSFSSGLYNSVRFIVQMLSEQGYDAVLASAIDNNCIDRMIHENKPTHVVLEALWVVPSKIEQLKALHPNVKWLVRLHSEVPFLAGEGIATEWLYQYADLGVEVVANTKRMCNSAELFLHEYVAFTPNYYPIQDIKTECREYETQAEVHVGCFGAIRPLKNHMIQAIAAMKYADSYNSTLHFHINGTRTEGNGAPILKNLRNLFAYSHHELIEHDWLDHDDFKNLVSKMDVVLQVSYTETFNIVAADAVAMHVPVVSSDEIKFVSRLFWADPNDVDDIARKLARAIFTRIFGLHRLNQWKLQANAERAIMQWKRFLKHL